MNCRIRLNFGRISLSHHLAPHLGNDFKALLIKLTYDRSSKKPTNLIMKLFHCDRVSSGGLCNSMESKSINIHLINIVKFVELIHLALKWYDALWMRANRMQHLYAHHWNIQSFMFSFPCFYHHLKPVRYSTLGTQNKINRTNFSCYIIEVCIIVT